MAKIPKIDVTGHTNSRSSASHLFSTPALAHMVWGDEDWDADGDGLVSLEEFREGSRERIAFGEVDVDANGGVTKNGLVREIFTRRDDGDADVTEALG